MSSIEQITTGLKKTAAIVSQINDKYAKFAREIMLLKQGTKVPQGLSSNIARASWERGLLPQRLAAARDRPGAKMLAGIMAGRMEPQRVASLSFPKPGDEQAAEQAALYGTLGGEKAPAEPKDDENETDKKQRSGKALKDAGLNFGKAFLGKIIKPFTAVASTMASAVNPLTPIINTLFDFLAPITTLFEVIGDFALGSVADRMGEVFDQMFSEENMAKWELIGGAIGNIMMTLIEALADFITAPGFVDTVVTVLQEISNFVSNLDWSGIMAFANWLSDFAFWVGELFANIGGVSAPFTNWGGDVLTPLQMLQAQLASQGLNAWGMPLATGGIVDSPTFALIGEAGPEAVIPLDRLDEFGGGGGMTVNINTSMVVGPDTVHVIARELRKLNLGVRR